MKSKTILSEEERIGQGKYNDFNYTLLVEEYHKALNAAEEEIELKEGSNQMLSNKMNHQREEIRSMKDAITIRDSEVSSLKKELEYKEFVIKGYIFNEEQFENEISSLKKEVERLKEENKKYSNYRNS